MRAIILKCLCGVLLTVCYLPGWAQNSSVSIGTEVLKDKAVLWLKSTGNQGLLLPIVNNRSSFTGLNNSDEKGMVIFDSSDNKVYYWNGSAWVEAGGGASGSNQTLTLSGNTFTLSGSPASNVNLSTAIPGTGQALVWNGSAWVATSLAGDVTGATGANQVSGLKGKVLPALPSSTQVLVYNGTSWVFQPLSAGTDSQDLTLSGTTLSLTNDATPVTLGALSILNSVSGATITDGTIQGVDIENGTITSNKLAQSSAATGQILKWNGTQWAAAADDVGTGAAILSNGQILVGNGTTNSAATLSGDATLSVGSLTIANSAITSAKIADGSITSADLATGAVTSGAIADGTIAAADINAMGATSGQVLKYNGSAWAPAADDAGISSALSSGQIVVGNASNIASPVSMNGDATISSSGTVTIANGAVSGGSGGKISDGSITAADLAVGAVTSLIIADGTISATDLNAMGATSGQILKYNGSAWVPAADNGTSYTGGTGISVTGSTITNTGDTDASDDLTTASLAAGDVTGLFSNLQIAANAVTDAEISSVAPSKITQAAATSGQVLKWNGTTWAPATDNSGISSTLTSAQILVGNGSNVATGVAMSGDATISNTGAVTISNGAISGGVGGKITDASITSADLSIGAVNSSAIADGSIVDADVNAAAAISGSKINPNFGTQSVSTTGSGSFAQLILSNEIRLAANPGTSGQVLTSAGPGAVPTWQNGVSFSTLNTIPKGDGTGLVASNIVENGGNVGIGIASPTAALHVVSPSSVTGYFSNTSTGGGTIWGVNSILSTSTTGTKYALWGRATGASTENYGVYGNASGATTNWAGYFEGNTAVTGALSVGVAPNFGATGQVLTSQGAGLAPTWTTYSGSALISNPGSENLFAGASVGTAGNNNSFFGSAAGQITTGGFNTFGGANSGRANTTAKYNTFYGSGTGYRNINGEYNLYVGADAAFEKTTGNLNTYVGFNAGKNELTGDANTFVGNKAGEGTVSPASNNSYNTFIGERAGQNNSTGNQNTILGRTAGLGNTTGFQNTILGSDANVGANNLQNATAVGYGASVDATNTMVFGNGNVIGWGFGAQPVAGRAIVVGTNATNGNGAWLSTGGSWNNGSDRNIKENFVRLDSKEILDKVRSLPITRWNYKGEPAAATHIGPMAQDFYALFNTGNDDKSISTIDPAGVALVSIQELIKKIELLEAENQKLKSDKSSLEAKVSLIEDQQKSFEKDLEDLKSMLGAEAKAK